MNNAWARNLAICGTALAWLGAPFTGAAATTDAATALAKLEKKVKDGGSGSWGAIPMPPNNVPDADLKTLVEWILAQK